MESRRIVTLTVADGMVAGTQKKGNPLRLDLPRRVAEPERFRAKPPLVSRQFIKKMFVGFP